MESDGLIKIQQRMCIIPQKKNKGCVLLKKKKNTGSVLLYTGCVYLCDEDKFSCCHNSVSVRESSESHICDQYPLFFLNELILYSMFGGQENYH